MATKKMQDGGTAATSGRMTRLGNKIARKTNAGKAVSTGLQKRYDKAVDKVIVKPLKEAAKEKVKTEKKANRKENITYAKAFLKGAVFHKPKTKEERQKHRAFMKDEREYQKQLKEEFPDSYRNGGIKVTYKKPLKKANNGTSVKAGPLTEKDTQMLDTNPWYKDSNSAYGYMKTGMRPTPTGYMVTPQKRENDKEKEIRSGANFKKGGMTKAKKFAALAPPYNKATAADRIAGAKKNKRK